MATITLSRQSGSEGNEVAQILSQRLGYQIFDKSLMNELAKAHGWDPDQFEDLTDEHHLARTSLEKILSSMHPPFGSLSGYSQYQYEDYEKITGELAKRIILAAYQRGNVIIVGRGGQVVLADKPDVFHVRVVASEAKRIRTWQLRDKLSIEAATKLVKERDKAHADFVKAYFDADIMACSLYDLVINTNKISPSDAADMIINSLKILKLVPG